MIPQVRFEKNRGTKKRPPKWSREVAAKMVPHCGRHFLQKNAFLNFLVTRILSPRIRNEHQQAPPKTKHNQCTAPTCGSRPRNEPPAMHPSQLPGSSFLHLWHCGVSRNCAKIGKRRKQQTLTSSDHFFVQKTAAIFQDR